MGSVRGSDSVALTGRAETSSELLAQL